jgi:site-specific recombinase XerD
MTQGLVEEGVAPASREDHLLRRSFVRFLRAEGISPTTVQRYELSVRQFQEFAQRMGFPLQVTREHVAHFLEWRLQGHASNTARNDYMALSRYLKWLLEEGEIRDNPMLHVKPPPLRENLPRPYTADEVRAMLRVCQGKDPQSLRDRAIILVLVDTGLRASEFCSLKVSDVNLDGEHIIVRGKRGKERLVRLGYKAQTAVDRYLRHRRSHLSDLWVGRGGQPLGPNGLFQLIERVAGRAGVANPGVHRFRHTAATWMRDRGIQTQELMYLLGWSTHKMAERYTHSTGAERALRAHREYSPADNLAP